MARCLFRKGFWFSLCAFVAVMAYFAYSVWQRPIERERRADSNLADLSLRIQDSLQVLDSVADSLFRVGNRNHWDLRTSDSLQAILRSFPRLYGAGTAMEPRWHNENPLPVVYYSRPGDGETIQKTEMPYDYTDSTLATAQWYHIVKSTGRAHWVGPYFCHAAQAVLVTYSRPLYNSHRKFIGIVATEYSLARIQNIFQEASRWEEGYALLLSGNGDIVYHPRVEILESHKSMREIAEQMGNKALLAFSDSLRSGSDSGRIAYRSIYTQEQALLKYRKIPRIGWYILCVVPDPRGQFFCTLQKHLFVMILALLTLAIWGMLLYCRQHRWLLSIGISLLFSAGVVVLCWISVQKFESGICESLSLLGKKNVNETSATDCSRAPLMNSFASSAYMNRCLQTDRKILGVPTGLIVQTLQFQDAYSFSVSGYLWQKYRNRQDTALLGIEFPESEEEELTIMYNDSLAPEQFVRGWHFSVTIRQPFSYRHYPLDKEEIWIRMRPQGLVDSILLEPDFGSYRAGGVLGTDPNLVLPQWSLLGSNFSYAINRANADYGRNARPGNAGYPELYFSIHVRRNILDAFISQFIPLLVILFMLFAILWVSRKQDCDGLLGFDSLSGASGCSALFFIVIYNHISIRAALGSQGIMYMEVFFFVAYLGLLFVSLNSIQVGMDASSRFINYEDNLIARILFWPVICGCCFFGTFLFFY